MKKREKEEKTKKVTLREKMAETLDASKEVILDSAKLTFVGNRELVVENYKSISEYNDNKIIIQANPSQISILGEELTIKGLARELLYITGKIRALEFKKEG